MALFGNKADQAAPTGENHATPFQPPASAKPSKNTKGGNSESVKSPPGQINMVGKGATIDGTLEVGGDVRVGGRVNGEVRVKGRLVITPEGRVEGLVSTREADIAGQVKGDIMVVDRLVVRKSAVVHGNITAAKLVIEDGAIFEGQCHMKSPSTGSKSTTSAASKPVAAAQKAATAPKPVPPAPKAASVQQPKAPQDTVSSPNKGDGANKAVQLNVKKPAAPTVPRR